MNIEKIAVLDGLLTYNMIKYTGDKALINNLVNGVGKEPNVRIYKDNDGSNLKIKTGFLLFYMIYDDSTEWIATSCTVPASYRTSKLVRAVECGHVLGWQYSKILSLCHNRFFECTIMKEVEKQIEEAISVSNIHEMHR